MNDHTSLEAQPTVSAKPKGLSQAERYEEKIRKAEERRLRDERRAKERQQKAADKLADQEKKRLEKEAKALEESEARILSFNVPGRPINLDALDVEFQAMLRFYKEGPPPKKNGRDEKKDKKKQKSRATPVPSDFARVAVGSGTHLLKMLTPRAHKDQAILRFRSPSNNETGEYIPSVNSSDIPLAKIVCRPLEIVGHRTRSLMSHILNPDDISNKVFEGFISVFGHDSFEALKNALLSDLAPISSLPNDDFPIIFVPNPHGGDLQITPLSPAANCMGLPRQLSRFFQKETKSTPKPRRGQWAERAISAKPQNISGAISGRRRCIAASMPTMMSANHADLMNFVSGGAFPTWRDSRVAETALKYADSLERDKKFNNQNTRRALDSMADFLVESALDFIEDTLERADEFKKQFDISNDVTLKAPAPSSVLLRLFWDNKQKMTARTALSGNHFVHRQRLIVKRRVK
jgi:hypothetical protein